MFNILKKKIGQFADKLKERIEGKIAAAEASSACGAAKEEEGERAAVPRAPAARKLKAKVSTKQKIRRALGAEIAVEERDVRDLFEDFRLSLLEADVEQETADGIVERIRAELVGKKIGRSEDVSAVLKAQIKEALEKLMAVDGKDVLKAIETKKPFVILFLGPNGAGKSTTIAKMTKLLQGKGKKVVWAAADTFRAASIEQLEKHAARLGVRLVKHTYGSDPAAVAFDAVRAAEASGADVVMIDSAGRQETNRNLMEELKKINRVAKADMRIYVGEAFSGQALLAQARKFDEALGIDGFILSKIDADAKGGTAISLIDRLRKPVLFLGTGQEYGDLVAFKPSYIVERVVG